MKMHFEKFRQVIRKNLPFLIIVTLLLLLLMFYLWNRIVHTVHAGEAAVLYKRFFGGTVVDKVYPEGIHLIFPWDKMTIYNVRIQEVAHDFDVLTVDGLKVALFISIRYYPEYKLLGILHQRVGEQYVEKIVIPEVKSVLRILIGKMNAEEVYTTEQAIYEKALNQATEEIAQRFINVDAVIIKKIEMPESVQKAIREKIEQKHIAEAHLFLIEREKKEVERKRIEAQGIKLYNEIIASSVSDKILLWKGINATLELAKSQNSKVIVIGNPQHGLPIIGTIPMGTEINDEVPPLALADEPKPETISAVEAQKEEKSMVKEEPK